MKSIPLAATLVAVLMAAPALAQAPKSEGGAVVTTEPGKGTAAVAVTAAASVEAIDKANRVVTLKGPQGKVFQVVASPEVRNFEQIKVGDEVRVRYLEAVTLELKKGGGAMRERVESSDAARAKAGEKPGAAEVRRVTVVADVTAVDPKTQTVTLRGPQRTVDLKLRDPKQFALVKVGDQVEATYTEAVALTVEPVAAAKK
jgi:hypothetical protein